MTDRLTPGEQRFVRWLPLIAEECAEIVKDAMKGLRFGLHDRPEDADKFSADNLAKIKLEIADLLAVLQSCGLDFSELNVAIEMKKQKLRIFGPDARPSPYLIEAARREAEAEAPRRSAAHVPPMSLMAHVTDAPPPPAPRSRKEATMVENDFSNELETLMDRLENAARDGSPVGCQRAALRAAVLSCTAGPGEVVVRGWQPIETVPVGERVLVASENEAWSMTYGDVLTAYVDEDEVWRFDCGMELEPDDTEGLPTHWMPVPSFAARPNEGLEK